MSESIEKKLIAAVSVAWNEVAPPLLGCPSTLSLLDSREVLSDGMNAALALAMTWPWAFAVSCSGKVGGVLICLFKSEQGEEIDRLVKPEIDGIPKPGGRALISGVLNTTAQKLTADFGTVTFSPAAYIDLTIDENRLTAIAGDLIEIGTCSLSLGEAPDTQVLMLYAPNGSLATDSNRAEAQVPKTSQTAKEELLESSEQTVRSAPPQATGSRDSGELRRLEAAPRNIERLLEVELDVVVRFGVTNVPLRDVVRMGVGTMIELNRAVDEPVELLVNGRQLARGEVVVVDGYYGVRITEISPVSQRASIL
jgi:flagellar motor switch protein FliN